MQIALLTERYEELQKTEETLGLISFGRFTREAADIKTSQQAQGQISTLKNDILDMEAKINGGIFDAKKLEEANNELQRMTSMVEFLATVRDIRIGEEFMDKNLKSVQDNLKLMNSVEGGDTRVDALSAKGWGSVGANMMQGVEVLQREANGLLRTIGTVVDRIAQDRQMQAVYS